MNYGARAETQRFSVNDRISLTSIVSGDIPSRKSPRTFASIHLHADPTYTQDPVSQMIVFFRDEWNRIRQNVSKLIQCIKKGRDSR
jgi:hypothetical protein